MNNPSWKSSPFNSIEEWKGQCKKSPIINDGDVLSFETNDEGSVICYIKEDKHGTELFVTVGYFFPIGISFGNSLENIQPNCGWSH
jgi:hypothetical protein